MRTMRRCTSMVKERKPNLDCKGLVIMKITEVCDCRSGAEAGKKLLWSGRMPGSVKAGCFKASRTASTNIMSPMSARKNPSSQLP